MAEASSLSERIKAEFDSRAQRVKASEEQRAKGAQEREQRTARFGKVCDELKGVWGPKLEEFGKQFGEKIKVTPKLTPSAREAKIDFLTDLANMTLTITASANADITSLVLDYDLLILPVFLEYERHSRLEMPLDKIDQGAIGKWIDDRLIACVKAYFSIHDNEYYAKRAMVEDPITKARFLPIDAKAKFEHEGKTYYFNTEESFRAFKTEKAGAEKPPAAAAPGPAGNKTPSTSTSAKPSATPGAAVAKPPSGQASPTTEVKPKVAEKVG